MSELYAYICTSQTADPFVPNVARDLRTFSRDVSDGFVALSGGHRTVGKIAFFPVQRSISHHLLCDGREVPKASFPELYAYLQDEMGTPSDPDNFVLPNYIGGGALTTAATADAEVTEGGTVTSGASSPGGGDSGGSINPPVDSGGRTRLQTFAP